MTEQTTQEHVEQKSNARIVIGIAVTLVIIVVVAAIVWWWLPAKQAQPQPTQPQPIEQPVAEPVEAEPVESEPTVEDADSLPEPVVEATPQEPEEPAEPEPELPALGESTPTVLQTLDNSGVAIQPLKSSQLVRDTVVIIDNLRNGTLVTDRTVVQRPDGRFAVLEIDGELYIDEASYQRYDALVDWFVSLDNDALVSNYQLFKPLMDEAYAEIGYPDMDISDAIVEAIDVLLATPVPESLVAVEDDEVMYTYANPAYEALPPAQKQLLRMGPDNIERIKQKLRALKRTFKNTL